ncbi:MAG: DUF308 domain-containing protein [Clostridia bacterium]|nr:DUF308 domain-containing protein [Clostridia bacterium]
MDTFETMLHTALDELRADFSDIPIPVVVSEPQVAATTSPAVVKAAPNKEAESVAGSELSVQVPDDANTVSEIEKAEYENPGLETENLESDEAFNEEELEEVNFEGESSEVEEPTYDGISEENFVQTELFDAKAHALTHGRKLRRTAMIFGILALIFSPTMVLGVLFGLFALLFAAIARVVTARKRTSDQKKALKRYGKSGFVLGLTAIIISVVCFIAFMVFFTFFGDFGLAVKELTESIFGKPMFGEFGSSMNEMFDSIRNLF